MSAKKKKIPRPKDIPKYKKVFYFLKRWAFFVGLLLGLIPFLVTVTPLNDILHPITINPSTVNPSSYDTISYFNVTNNRDITLYEVQIQIDLPQGLTPEDIEIEKLTHTDNTVVEIPGTQGSIMWDTSIWFEEAPDFIIMHLDRVLPGESNIISFSIQVKASKATEPIKLSCSSYSKKPAEIFSGP